MKKSHVSDFFINIMIGDIFFNYEMKNGSFEYDSKQYRDIGVIVDDALFSSGPTTTTNIGAYLNCYNGLNLNEVDDRIVIANILNLSPSNIEEILHIYECIFICEKYDVNQFHPYYYDFPLLWNIYNGIHIDKLRQSFGVIKNL